MDETRDEFERGCLTYGVTARGTFARPGDDIWSWRGEHEREQRQASWEWLEGERRATRRKLVTLKSLLWLFRATVLWQLWRAAS